MRRVRNAARAHGLPREPADERAELRRVDRVTRRAHDDEVGRSAARGRAERARSSRLARCDSGLFVGWPSVVRLAEHQCERRDREHDGTDPGADRAPRMATARARQALGHVTSCLGGSADVQIYAASSRSRGTRNRGMTLTPPSHASSRAASASTSVPVASAPTSSSNGTRPRRPSAPPIRRPCVRSTRPSAPRSRSDRTAPGVLAEIPGALFPAHHRRVERRQQHGPGLRRRRRLDIASMTNSGHPSTSTSTAPIAASVARVCVRVQPVHHFRSATLAGPNAGASARKPFPAPPCPRAAAGSREP